MPSNLPLPSIIELRKSFHDAVRGAKESTADGHDGSVYDHFAGLGSILWSWQAQRDKDLFTSIYFDYSSGQELTDYVLGHDKLERTEDSAGTGFIDVVRPSNSSGSGTFWKGTRVQVFHNSTSIEYIVGKDTLVQSSDLGIQVPITASFIGSSSKIDSSSFIVKIVDPLWDNTWTVSRIVCGEGTKFEQAADFRSRVRQTRKSNRVGYEDIIIKTCEDLGAKNIFLLRSDYAGADNDTGVNVVYVGDENYVTTDLLRNKCIVGLESVRVLGADLLVLPLSKQSLSFSLNVDLWTDPSKFDVVGVKTAIANIIIDYFKGSQFSYDLNAITGSIRRIMPDIVQSIEYISPTIGQGILVNGGAPAI